MAETTFHVAMFPWFAMGHLTPFLHLSNKFAERGHRVSFLLPTRTGTKLEHFNLHPNLINFVPLDVPAVDGLPPGAETMSDVPLHMAPCLMTAMYNMRDQVEAILNHLKPDLIFFDVANWIPSLARPLGIISICHCVLSVLWVARIFVPSRKIHKFQQFTDTEIMTPPPDFPPSTLHFKLFEARQSMIFASLECISGMSFYEVLTNSMKECDALSFRTCREIEGPYCDYIESQYKKQVLLTGPNMPELPTCQLEERWAKWLGGFEGGSVIYCAFGSECVLMMDQFQELVLGLELTGLPFLVALKPPVGAATVDEALPEGFKERVEGRGVVHGGWVQQTLILGHPSVGCFVSHCGYGSMWESLMSDCQIVLVPEKVDQFMNSKIMSSDLKVAVEVERGEEDGKFTREGICKAVKLVMDGSSKVGNELKANHAKWKEFLLRPGLESSYINSYIQKVQGLLC